MNKNIYKFLSISALLTIGIPYVEGVRTKNWSQKKTYSNSKKMDRIRSDRSKRNDFVDQLIQINGWNNIARCFNIDKRCKKPVHLNARFINFQQIFDNCFNDLHMFAGQLDEISKLYCLQLMDDLVSIGNRKGFTQLSHTQTLANLRNTSIARSLDFNAVEDYEEDYEEDDPDATRYTDMNK